MLPVELHIAGQACFAGEQEKEWLITNGLGGYASGTLSGVLTRRYHGLFLPNLANPKGRHLMISHYADAVHVGGTVADLNELHARSDALATSERSLQEFVLAGNIARWRYRIGDVLIDRSIFMPHGQNTVCVRYQLVAGDRVVLKLRPYFAFRRQDAPLQASGYGAFSLTLVEQRLECALQGSDLTLRIAVTAPRAVFTAEADEFIHELQRERKRGNEFREAAYSPGYFDVDLIRGETIAFVATTHNAKRLVFDFEAALDAETKRIASLHDPSLAGDRIATLLSQAADQFRVLPASRIEDAIVANGAGQEFRTVIAGYHWFGDWGRDTMISLEGLMLCTKRYGEARATLQTFAGYVRDGLIPNLFPEGERQGLYHTVDATLWYFHALHRYLEATNDFALLAELMPSLEGILERHFSGTLFNIHVKEDGLLFAGAEGYQLTWMDAKVDDWVVTPRRGKPVEIQALWYNALQLMQRWTTDETKRKSWASAAARTKTAFNRRYWNPERHCLRDVVDGPEGDDPSIRPNQLFAISLDHPILEADHWRDVLSVVTAELLTPYGLRTLSRDHPEYRSTYHGNLRFRDAAYHQGTVWPWLLGHYTDAALKSGAARSEVHERLRAFENHLQVAGIGSISEVFDAEPPHLPHGCVAQAWSVAEILRSWLRTRA